MKKQLIIFTLILFISCACSQKEARPVIPLNDLNTARIDNPKSFKGGNITDDWIGKVAQTDTLKIKDYAKPNIKIKIFMED